MNERINKLKEQAKEKVISHGAYGETEIYWEINVDKFAELIVKECVMIGCRAFHNDHGIVQSFPTDQIKEHFGVK